MPLQADQRRRKVIYPNGAHDPASAAQRWWLVKPADIYKHVWMVAEDILVNMAVRRRMNYFFAALYNDTGAGFMASRHINLYYNRTALDGNAMLSSRMSLNVLQNCIDTAVAMIAKNKPKPQFATDGNEDYATRERGKLLTRYVAGLFDDMRLYEVARRVFLDSCIYGTGALKLYESDGRLCAENLFIEELLVDDLEGMHGCPTQLHQRKYLPRDEVAARYPEFADQINSSGEISGTTSVFSTADIIPVIESWHLPSAPGAKDGMHSIVIENCTLFSEPYEKDYFPILFFRWANQTLGFWGRGIAHEIWKLQRELDITLQTIQLAQRLVSGPVICVEAGSNVSEDHITNNKLAKVIEYTVTQPSFLTPPIAQPELYQHAQYLEDRMYKVTGISQSIATGNKPAEVRSAVAIRESGDIATGRFGVVAQRWEEFFLEIARICVDMSSDLLANNKDLAVMGAGPRSTAKRISFRDAKMELDEYRLQLFPVSGLPHTPAGRLDQLMDYAQAGYITKEQVMDVVDFPDLEEVTSLEVAAYRRTQEILSEIKLHGKYTPPGMYLNHKDGISYRMACLEVDRAESQGVPEKNVELLRKWADECLDRQQEWQRAMMPAAPAQMNAGTPGQSGMSAEQGGQLPPGAAPQPQPPQVQAA